MPILVDLNQVAISNLMVAINSYSKNEEIDEGLIRHMVLNSLRMYKVKFGDKYGDLVICCDARHYWRRKVFPFYKSTRKKDRKQSPLDWTLIFETLNKIRDEIEENFPYKVISVEGAEADDCIATIVSHHSNSVDNILILSGDKDFMQLHNYMNVDQYAPVQKKFLRTSDPKKYLKEHILRGDRSDGVPNFLSPDNSLISGIRQKTISKKKLEQWLSSDNPEDFCDENMLRGYHRNRQLIDLACIPQEIQSMILDCYDINPGSDRSKIFNYFIKNRMKILMEHIQEF